MSNNNNITPFPFSLPPSSVQPRQARSKVQVEQARLAHQSPVLRVVYTDPQGYPQHATLESSGQLNAQGMSAAKQQEFLQAIGRALAVVGCTLVSARGVASACYELEAAPEFTPSQFYGRR